MPPDRRAYPSPRPTRGMATERADRGSARERGFVLVRAAAVVVVAFLVALLLAGLGIQVFGMAGVPQDGLVFRVGLTVLQFVGFGIGIAGYFQIAGDWDLLRDHVRRPSARDVGLTIGGLLALLGAATAVGQVLSALGVEVAQNQVVAVGREDPTFFLYMIPVSLLLVGPMEELLFRGTVQGLLRRVWSPAIAIVVASAMFGVVHWIALMGAGSKVSYVAIAAALGLILGAVYELSDNVIAPALAHGGYNAVLFGVQYAIATGTIG